MTDRGRDDFDDLREDDVQDRLYGADDPERPPEPVRERHPAAHDPSRQTGPVADSPGREEQRPRATEGGQRPSGIELKAVERRTYDVSSAPREDAMGRDKRRPVVGQAYGPSAARQFTVWLGAVGVLVALFIGATIAINELDAPPDNYPAEAPWENTNEPPRRFL